MDAIRALIGNPITYAADAAYALHLYPIGDVLNDVAARIL